MPLTARNPRTKRWWRYEPGQAGLAVTLAALVLGGCSLFAPAPRVENGWIVPTPLPLPLGAQAVEIEIATLPRPLRADAIFGCPKALLAQVRVEHRPGDTKQPVRYTSAGRPVRIAWQEGLSARLAPRLEIVAPDGTVVLREGGKPVDFGGGALGAEGDEVFGVCMDEYLPQRAQPAG